MTTVIYYLSPRGDNPVKEFIDSHPSVKSKALRILAHIKEFGLDSAIPHLKKLTGTPLWEIRILGKDNTRILYVAQTKQQIVLIHAFLKKTQKTPPKEIQTALSRLRQLAS